MATPIQNRDPLVISTGMPRRKSTPAKRPLAQAVGGASKRSRRPSRRPAFQRQRTDPLSLSCPADADDWRPEDSLRLQFPLRETPHGSLLAALGALCSGLGGRQLRIDATLLANDQVELQAYGDNQTQQLPLTELFPDTYEAWRPHVAVLAELQLLALHVVATRPSDRDHWAFSLSVGVAWRNYMRSCSSRGLVPVLAAPQANPARAMHHVMIWLLKLAHDAQSTVVEATCTYRYWNEVEVLFDRFVGSNATACARFETQVFEMPEIYARIDAACQLSRDTSAYESIEASSSDLLPTLRAYQKAAVSWMLARETSELHQGPLLPLSVIFSESAAHGLQAYNPFCAAFHVATGTLDDQQGQLRPVALKLFEVHGGILADEMGLGKTVEVIALMLSHRRPSLTPQLLSTHTRHHTRDANNGDFEEDVMACICGSEDDHPMGTVQCDFCGTWHHQLCTGYTASGSVASNSNDEPRSTASSLGLWSFDVSRSSTNGSSSPWPSRGFMCYHCQSQERPIFASHATLIVSPEPIHAQWQNELSRHVRTDSLSVIRYPGVRALRTRLEGTGPSAEWQILASPGLLLSRFDVVLTTYETLAADLRHVPTVEGGDRRSSLRCGRKRYAFVGSPLVGLHFWRVCMDEAQVGVENTRLQAALTVARISAENRWVVTGTPFSSRVSELFGYLRFLRIAPYTSAQVAGTESGEHFYLQQGQTERQELEGLDMAFFREAIERCFTRGAVERVLDQLLWNGEDAADIVSGGGILWRTGKRHVLDQLGLPPQKNEVVWCRFAAVERHFYDQQENRIVSLIQQRQHEQREKWQANNVIARDDRLWQDLLILRQLCCHPQVGSARQAWAISGNLTAGAVMTMDAFLQELVSKAKRECEEAQRQLIGAQNGLAALLVLEHNFSGAALKYMALMGHIRTNWPRFRADLLPRLHILQNLEKCVHVLFALPGGEDSTQHQDPSQTNIDSVVDPTKQCVLPELPVLEKRVSSTGLDPDCADLDDDVRMGILRECTLLGQSAIHIRQCYLLQAEGSHSQARSVYQEISQKVDSEQSQQSRGGKTALLCTSGSWWNDALAIIEQGDHDDQQQLVTRVHARLAGFGTRWGTSFCSQLISARSLRLLLVHELEMLAKRRRKLFDRLADLSDGTPTEADVELSGNCVKCRDGGTGPTCVHCQLYKELESYRQHFLGIDKTAAGRSKIMDLLEDDEDFEDEVVHSATQAIGGGSSKSLFIEVFKEIAGCARNALRSQQDGKVRATEVQSSMQREMEFWARLQREWQAAKKLFQAQHQRLGALDELVMACSQLRLRQPGEPEARTKAERLYKLEPAEVPARVKELEGDRAVADHELRDKMAQLRYLLELQGETESSQAHQQENDTGSESTTTMWPVCAVCLQELTRKRAVLPCAHVFCRACVSSLAGGKHKRNDVRCPTCRRVCPVDSVTKIIDDSTSASSSRSPPRSEPISDHHPQPALSHRPGGGLGSKLDALLGRVDSLRQENPTVKCLLFSQWPQMLELAVRALPRFGVRCFMYATKRKLPTLLSQFQSCPTACVLALPFKVGANGLNIVEATEVLLVEPLLSASIEAQAVNRVHRLGQTRRTRVHRFIVQGSIEERIYHLGHRHLQIDHKDTKENEELPRLGVAPGRKEQEKLTIQDLQELLHKQGNISEATVQEEVESEPAIAFWEELVVLNEKCVTRSAACELLERRRAAELRASDPRPEDWNVTTSFFGKTVALLIADELFKLPCPESQTAGRSPSLSEAIELHRKRVGEEIRVWRAL